MCGEEFTNSAIKSNDMKVELLDVSVEGHYGIYLVPIDCFLDLEPVKQERKYA